MMIQAQFPIYTLSSSGVIRQVFCPIVITPPSYDDERVIKEFYIPEQLDDFLILSFPLFLINDRDEIQDLTAFSNEIGSIGYNDIKNAFLDALISTERMITTNPHFGVNLTTVRENDDSLFIRKKGVRHYFANNPEPLYEPPEEFSFLMNILGETNYSQYQLGIDNNDTVVFSITSVTNPQRQLQQKFVITVDSPDNGENYQVKIQGDNKCSVEWYSSYQNVNFQLYHPETQQSWTFNVYRR